MQTKTFQGTPGPWHSIDTTQKHPKRDGYTGTFDILDKDQHITGSKIIAGVNPYGGNFPTHEEAKANAQLIAAAPELLYAAQYALGCLDRLNVEMGQIGDNGDQAYNALKEAIEKALMTEQLEGTGALAD